MEQGKLPKAKSGPAMNITNQNFATVPEGAICQCTNCGREKIFTRNVLREIVEKYFPDREGEALYITELSRFRCSKCGAKKIKIRPQQLNAIPYRSGASQQTKPTPRPSIKDIYNISTEEAKAVIASGFDGIGETSMIIIYNQVDRLSLTADEHRCLDQEYKKAKSKHGWSPHNAFCVYASTDGQD